MRNLPRSCDEGGAPELVGSAGAIDLFGCDVLSIWLQDFRASEKWNFWMYLVSRKAKTTSRASRPEPSVVIVPVAVTLSEPSAVSAHYISPSATATPHGWAACDTEADAAFDWEVYGAGIVCDSNGSGAKPYCAFAADGDGQRVT